MGPDGPKARESVNSIVFRLTYIAFFLYYIIVIQSNGDQAMRDVRPDYRRSFIGGSDARIIMGSDEQALIRLWREKRGEVEPEDLVRKSSGSARSRHRGAQSPLV
jgi:hypothetical protein